MVFLIPNRMGTNEKTRNHSRLMLLYVWDNAATTTVRMIVNTSKTNDTTPRAISMATNVYHRAQITTEPAKRIMAHTGSDGSHPACAIDTACTFTAATVHSPTQAMELIPSGTGDMHAADSTV